MSWGWVTMPRRLRLPETPKLVLVLTLAGLFSGLTIVGIYRVTLPVIQENNARALREAVFEVVPGSERMQRLVWTGEDLEPAEGVMADEPSVYGAYTAAGELAGYAIPAEGAGFQDTIKLIYGYDPGRERIVGMEVLESRETPGLGDRIYKDEVFVGRFRDLAVEPEVVLVKEEPTAPNQVDAITGATISAQAVVNIVQGGNETWLERLPPAGEAPALLEEREGDVPAERGGPIPGGRS